MERSLIFEQEKVAPENSTHNPSRSSAPAQKTPSGLGLYFFLLAVQTTGALIVLVNGVPIYRQMVRDFSKHEPEPGILW